MAKHRNPNFQAHVWHVMQQHPVHTSKQRLAQLVGCTQSVLERSIMTIINTGGVMDSERGAVWRDRLSITSEPAPTRRQFKPETIIEAPTKKSIVAYVTPAMYGRKKFPKGNHIIQPDIRVRAINAFIMAEGSVYEAAAMTDMPHQRIHSVVYSDWNFIPKEFFPQMAVHSVKARKWLVKQAARDEKKRESAEAAIALPADVEQPETVHHLKRVPDELPTNVLETALIEQLIDSRVSDLRSEMIDAVNARVGKGIGDAFYNHAKWAHAGNLTKPSQNGSIAGNTVRVLTAPFRFAGRRMSAISKAVIRG